MSPTKIYCQSPHVLYYNQHRHFA